MMHFRMPALATSLAIAVLGFLPVISYGQVTYNWTGSTGGAWLTASNWSGGPAGTVPGMYASGGALNGTANDTAVFANGATNSGINMNTTGGLFQLGAISLSGSTNIQIGNSSTTVNGILQLNGATIAAMNDTLLSATGANLTIANVNSGAGTQTMGLQLGINNGIFNAGAERTIAVSSSISDGGLGFGFNVTGGGLVALSGANTYTGGTTVSAGTIAFLNVNAKPAVGTVSVSAASSLSLGVGGAGFFSATDVDNLWAGTIVGDLTNISMDPAAGVGIDTSAGSFTYSTIQTTRSLVKTGTNTLSLTGDQLFAGPTTIFGGTLQLGDGTLNGSVAGNIVNNSATLNFNIAGETTAVTHAGDISGTGSGGSNGILVKAGPGTLTLSGTNTYAGSTYVNGGVLIMNSATSVIGSLTNNPSSNMTGTATGASALRMSAGTMNIGGAAAPQWIVGAASYAGVELSGGTINYNPTANNAASRFSFRRGYVEQTGGTINLIYSFTGTSFTGGQELIIGSGGDRGVYYATGGTVNFTNSGTYTSPMLIVGDTTTAGGGSDLTIADTADWTMSGTAAFVRLTRTAASQTGNLNLNDGGRLTTRGILLGTGSGSIGRLNFDGGILRAVAANTTFLPTSSNFTTRIYSGGATIDTDGVNVTIPGILAAPVDSVVDSIALTSGGSGYIAAPIVRINGGGGTGATAVATYDPVTGSVTGFIITSPGSGYTSDPTATLVGGTQTLAGGIEATIGAISLTSAPTIGGLTKIGLGTLTLSGANTYTGTTNINNGTLALGGAGTLGASTAPLSLNGGMLNLGTLSRTTGPVNVTTAASGDVIANGSLSAPSFDFSNSMGNAIVSANLVDGGGSPLTKTGAGKLTLSGVNAYTGATTLTLGSLFVNGAGVIDAASPVGTASGTTLGGTGSINGTATISVGGILEAGSGGLGSLTLGGLVFSGSSTVNIGTLASYTGAPAFPVFGDLTTNGTSTVSIQISDVAGVVLNTPYKIFSYGTYSGGTSTADFSVAPLPARAISSLANSGNEITLTITGIDTIIWTGSANLANGWDTATNNWNLTSNNSPTAYINTPPDVVTFNDSVSATSTTVNINAAAVSPNSVTFDNSTRDYIMQGTFGITGTTGLTKGGVGSLTITNVNGYTGVTALNGGTVTFGSSGLGSGDITFGGGTLQFAAGNTDDIAARIKNSTAEIRLDTGAGSVVLTGVIDSTNTQGFAKLGSGTLTLGGGNTYSGNTAIANGTLALATSSDRLPIATIVTLGDGTLNTSGSLMLDGRNQSLIGLLTAGTGTDNRVVGGNATASTLTLNIDGSNTFDGVLGGSGTNDNNFALTKTGGGILTLTNANTFTGLTTIGGGVLALSGADNRLPTTGTVSFTASASLDLGATSQTLANVSSPSAITASVAGTTLTVNGGAFQVGIAAAGSSQIFDFSGLSTFDYDSATTSFRVSGLNTAVSAGASGTLSLPATTSITATAFILGDLTGNNNTTVNSGTVNLGTDTTINADSLIIGGNRSAGTLQYLFGTDTSLTIRGSDETSRAASMTLGVSSGPNIAGQVGTVDLATNVGGTSTLDAMITTLTIGKNARGSQAGGNSLITTGNFVMGGGALDAVTIIIGQNLVGFDNGGSSSSTTGILTVNGGTVTVGTLFLADQQVTHTLGSSAVINATLNLNSGATLKATTIANGTGTGTDTANRTINWNDGTITTVDASTNLAITAGPTLLLADTGTHTFNIGTGLTGTVDALIADAITGGTLNKAGPGTLILTNANTYTGSTTVGSGSMALSDSGSFATSPQIIVGTAPGSTAVLQVNALTGGSNFNGANFTLAFGQALGGHGTVNAATVGFAAPSGTTIAPGTSAGTLAITGSAILGGAYDFELATAGAGSTSFVPDGFSSPALPHTNFDVITVSGTADVSGLIVNIASIDSPATGFDNTLNYSWTILTSGGLTGTATLGSISGTVFSNPGAGTFMLSQDSTALYLNFVQPVPEPALGLLLLAGLLPAIRRRIL